MNFFEHQEKAHKQTRWLVLLFVLALIAVVAAMEILVLLFLGQSNTVGFKNLVDPVFLKSNVGLIGGTAVLTLAVIGFSTLFRMTSLRAGGGKVAVELGGVRVGADPRDPLRRRLRNVVEEVALASGMPVPEIYVMEKEPGINAFAAGYTPADAAIAVTRGTLEKLSRDELQGVISHEFSHILNGDMRLNIRLIGLLFGIMMLSLIARRVLFSARYTRVTRSSNSNSSGGGAIMIIALGVLVVGYIGMFFARWIKAAVSRQREYLADASAVQFTRNPDGIAGALKRIAIEADGSLLQVESEEVSHMLFGEGRRASLLATHPPLLDRIKRIQPQFNPEELKTMASSIRRKQRQAAEDEERLRKRAEKKDTKGGAGMFDAGNIIENIGNPDSNQLLYAALVASSLPMEVQSAARSAEWAPETLCLLLLDSDPAIREKQLLLVSRRMGTDSEKQLRTLQQALPNISPEQRLPLAEMTFPALKRRPAEDLMRLLDTIRALITADGKVDVHEYALAKMLEVMINDALNPADSSPSGRKSIKSLSADVEALLMVVANLGQTDATIAEKAWNVGMQMAGLSAKNYQPGDWRKVLDTSLARLDRLAPKHKEVLLRSLLETITSDHEVNLIEAELLRAICASLHVPLPMIEL
ncbi:MAG: M48 family metallopeptidase [Xanthomonadales bacterium]|nr:M48 family metallopeptidase [Xanthomonadales bacterium]